MKLETSSVPDWQLCIDADQFIDFGETGHRWPNGEPERAIACAEPRHRTEPRIYHVAFGKLLGRSMTGSTLDLVIRTLLAMNDVAKELIACIDEAGVIDDDPDGLIWQLVEKLRESAR